MEFEKTTDLANITVDATSAAATITGLDSPGVTLSGAFGGGSVQAEISYDSAEFAAFGTPLTAAGHLVLPPCQQVRFVTSGSTTPVVVIRIGGTRSFTTQHKGFSNV